MSDKLRTKKHSRYLRILDSFFDRALVTPEYLRRRRSSRRDFSEAFRKKIGAFSPRGSANRQSGQDGDQRERGSTLRAVARAKKFRWRQGVRTTVFCERVSERRFRSRPRGRGILSCSWTPWRSNRLRRLQESGSRRRWRTAIRA